MSARTKVAHNFHGSVFETLSKRCDSNNPTSTFETHASELRATLLSNLSSRGLRGLAAVPVGGGGAWPGFETTRRAKLAARTARGRAAAHGHTKQPGPNTTPARQPEIRRRRNQADTIRQKVVAPRKTWGPPLMRSHA